MNPLDVSINLRTIASYIDLSNRPSLRTVSDRLASIIVATDQTVALEIRSAIASGITRLLPDEFDGSLYDTASSGKGRVGGYISFGMDPNSFENNDLIGGILFKCKYDKSHFTSEAPDPIPASWSGHSMGGAVIDLDVECGYYNKRFDGSYTYVTQLGTFTVELNDLEKVVDQQFSTSSSFERGIRNVIDQVLSNPPAASISSKRLKKSTPPNTSEVALLKWLLSNNRSSVSLSEIQSVARTKVGKGTARGGPGIETQHIIDWFISRGWSVDMNS